MGGLVALTCYHLSVTAGLLPLICSCWTAGKPIADSKDLQDLQLGYQGSAGLQLRQVSHLRSLVAPGKQGPADLGCSWRLDMLAVYASVFLFAWSLILPI